MNLLLEQLQKKKNKQYLYEYQLQCIEKDVVQHIVSNTNINSQSKNYTYDINAEENPLMAIFALTFLRASYRYYSNIEFKDNLFLVKDLHNKIIQVFYIQDEKKFNYGLIENKEDLIKSLKGYDFSETVEINFLTINQDKYLKEDNNFANFVATRQKSSIDSYDKYGMHFKSSLFSGKNLTLFLNSTDLDSRISQYQYKDDYSIISLFNRVSKEMPINQSTIELHLNELISLPIFNNSSKTGNENVRDLLALDDPEMILKRKEVIETLITNFLAHEQVHQLNSDDIKDKYLKGQFFLTDEEEDIEIEKTKLMLLKERQLPLGNTKILNFNQSGSFIQNKGQQTLLFSDSVGLVDGQHSSTNYTALIFCLLNNYSLIQNRYSTSINIIPDLANMEEEVTKYFKGYSINIEGTNLYQKFTDFVKNSTTKLQLCGYIESQVAKNQAQIANSVSAQSDEDEAMVEYKEILESILKHYNNDSTCIKKIKLPKSAHSDPQLADKMNVVDFKSIFPIFYYLQLTKNYKYISDKEHINFVEKTRLYNFDDEMKESILGAIFVGKKFFKQSNKCTETNLKRCFKAMNNKGPQGALPEMSKLIQDLNWNFNRDISKEYFTKSVQIYDILAQNYRGELKSFLNFNVFINVVLSISFYRGNGKLNPNEIAENIEFLKGGMEFLKDNAEGKKISYQQAVRSPLIDTKSTYIDFDDIWVQFMKHIMTDKEVYSKKSKLSHSMI